MQQGARTPSSILKRRPGQVDSCAQAKKMRGKLRRVSFAPDDELETRHLYLRDDARPSPPQDLSEPLANDLDDQFPTDYWNPGQAHPASTMFVPESSPGFSPLSMDLTNHSLENSTPSTDEKQTSTRLASNTLVNLQNTRELTLNITGAVPALSTLLEEYEDDPNLLSDNDENNSAMDLTQTATSYLNASRSKDGHVKGVASCGTTHDMRAKWGFVPGEEDTLQVDLKEQGRKLMGDTTFNHVYGGCATGEVTLALRNGQLPQMGSGALGGDRLFVETPAAGPQLPEEVTAKLLSEEETNPWAGLLGRGILVDPHPSVGSNVVTLHSSKANVAHRDATSLADLSTSLLAGPELGFIGHTTELLAATTEHKELNALLMRLKTKTEGRELFGEEAEYRGIVSTTTSSSAFSSAHANGFLQPSCERTANSEPSPGYVGQSQCGQASQQNMTAKMSLVYSHNTEPTVDEMLDDLVLPPEPPSLSRQCPKDMQADKIAPIRPLQSLGSPDKLPPNNPSSNQACIRRPEPLFGSSEKSKLQTAPTPKFAPITMQDFLLLVDMQFLDHVRRGPSLHANGQMLLVGAAPSTLGQCLELCHLHGIEASLMEDWILQLQTLIQEKRIIIAQQESTMTSLNPKVFELAQVARGNDLEQLKALLVIVKKICRCHTKLRWKRIRGQLESQLSGALRTSNNAMKQLVAHVKGATNQLERIHLHANQAFEESVKKQHGIQQANQRRLMLATSMVEQQQVLDRHEATREKLQGRYESLLQKRLQMQRQLAEVQARLHVTRSPSCSNVGAGDRVSTLKTQTIATMVQRKQELDIIKGITGWNLVGLLESSNVWCFHVNEWLEIHLDSSKTLSIGLMQPTFKGVDCVMDSEIYKEAIPHLERLVNASFECCNQVILQRKLRSLHSQMAIAIQRLTLLDHLHYTWPWLANVAIQSTGMDANHLEALLVFIEPQQLKRLDIIMPLMPSSIPELQVSSDDDVARADVLSMVGKLDTHGPLAIYKVCTYVHDALSPELTNANVLQSTSRLPTGKTPLRMYNNPLYYRATPS